jgi:chitodextrinase
VSASAIDLAWTASTDDVAVTLYKIFRDGTQIATSAMTNYSDTGLAPSTVYTYAVSACDAASNCSAQSGTASAMTQAAPDTEAPTIATGLVAVAAGAFQINLSWSASSDNVGVILYYIYRNGGLIAAVLSGTSYSDAGLAASTVYRYSVAACDAAFNCSPGSPEVSARTPRVRADLDGDGRSDILWRNGATGENYVYPMNGLEILGTEGYLRAVPDLSWRVVGVGDFDIDGRADILWRNMDTGETYVYFMNGSSIVNEGYLRTVVDQNWQVVGIGDFDGNGTDDILWRNSATGENYVYFMFGLWIFNEGYLRTVPNQDWQVAGVGDFDGDGTADILWRNSASGENYVYRMDRTDIVGEGYLRTVAEQAWQVKGVGDSDGDGKADILWRNAATGENYLYLMQGISIAAEGYLRTVSDLAWQIVGVGDYDGDARSDIVWRNSSTGENYLYLMDGAAIKPTEGYLRTVPVGNWAVAGALGTTTIDP